LGASPSILEGRWKAEDNDLPARGDLMLVIWSLFASD